MSYTQNFFSRDFYPTPFHVIEMMLEDIALQGKTILEPSAGKGDIVDFCIGAGAHLLACEKHPDLQKIVAGKCKVIADDFLQVKAEQVSHIDMIVMNPPFSEDEKHLLHAIQIAPPGCKIIGLCNAATLTNDYSRTRRELLHSIEAMGYWQNIGDVFTTAERKTEVQVALIRLQKPGESRCDEFEGFFTEEDHEAQGNGIMPYNAIRDLVNRYVAAVKLFDEQLNLAVMMNELTSSFFSSKLAFQCKQEDRPVTKAEFKKDLQKAAWQYVFRLMKMEKYSTRGLKADLNKFVEQQQQVPFTMRNIYKMLDIVIGTHSQRMDKALLEVFDRITSHYDENRFQLEGWKTNSHYLVNEKFILPYLARMDHGGTLNVEYHNDRYEVIDDFTKALCHITGKRYEEIGSIWDFFHRKEPLKEGQYSAAYVKYAFNTWYDFGFFQLKGFKKGTMHFKFKDRDVWALFNQHVARIKGFPLPEKL